MSQWIPIDRTIFTIPCPVTTVHEDGSTTTLSTTVCRLGQPLPRLASTRRTESCGLVFLLSNGQEVTMNPMPVFRSLILVILMVWLSIPLIAGEQYVFASDRLVASQAQEPPSCQQKQQPIAQMTEREKEAFNKFVN